MMLRLKWSRKAAAEFVEMEEWEWINQALALSMSREVSERVSRSDEAAEKGSVSKLRSIFTRMRDDLAALGKLRGLVQTWDVPARWVAKTSRKRQDRRTTGPRKTATGQVQINQPCDPYRLSRESFTLDMIR